MFLNSDLGQLFALNPTNGALKWTTSLLASRTNGLLASSPPAIGRAGVIFFGASNFVFAVNPTTGNYLWTFQSPRSDENFLNSPAVSGDGTVYIESWTPSTNRLFAFNPTNGVVKWSITLKAVPLDLGEKFLPFSYGTVAVAADGEIYVTDTYGMVFSLAPDGSTNWTYKLESYSFNGPPRSPIIGPDGTLSLGTFLTGCTPLQALRRSPALRGRSLARTPDARLRQPKRLSSVPCP